MRQRVRKLIGITLVLVVASVLTTVAGSRRFADGDFATPEKAIEHFTESVKAGDAKGVIESFAVSRYAEKFDFDAATNRNEALDQNTAFPSKFGFYRSFGEMRRAAVAATQTQTFIASMVSTQRKVFVESTVALLRSKADVSKLAASLDPKRVKDLKLLATLEVPIKSNTLYDKVKKTDKLIAKAEGADDAAEYLAFYQLDRETFMEGFLLFRYGKNWSLKQLSSPVANNPANGAATRATASEFAKAADPGS